MKYTEKLAALLCITLATGKAWLPKENLYSDGAKATNTLPSSDCAPEPTDEQ